MGEVHGLALNPAASVMKWSNILQRTGIIGSNPIVAALYPSRRVRRAKTRHRFRFDSGKRAEDANFRNGDTTG